MTNERNRGDDQRTRRRATGKAINKLSAVDSAAVWGQGVDDRVHDLGTQVALRPRVTCRKFPDTWWYRRHYRVSQELVEDSSEIITT